MAHIGTLYIPTELLERMAYEVSPNLTPAILSKLQLYSRSTAKTSRLCDVSTAIFAPSWIRYCSPKSRLT